jgi:hypothetical protein
MEKKGKGGGADFAEQQPLALSQRRHYPSSNQSPHNTC